MKYRVVSQVGAYDSRSKFAFPLLTLPQRDTDSRPHCATYRPRAASVLHMPTIEIVVRLVERPVPLVYSRAQVTPVRLHHAVLLAPRKVTVIPSSIDANIIDSAYCMMYCILPIAKFNSFEEMPNINLS